MCFCRGGVGVGGDWAVYKYANKNVKGTNYIEIFRVKNYTYSKDNDFGDRGDFDGKRGGRGWGNGRGRNTDREYKRCDDCGKPDPKRADIIMI